MADPAPLRDAGTIRAATREVFSRPNLAEPKRHWYSLITDFIADPLGTALRGINRLLDLFVGTDAAPFFAWAFAALAAIVIVFLLFRLTRSVGVESVAQIHYAPSTGIKSSRQLREEAADLEARSEWRTAIRCRYSALVAELAEQDLLEKRDGKTTGEYVREMALGAPDTASAFREATAIFEWVWYGKGRPDGTDAARMRDLGDEVHRSVAA